VWRRALELRNEDWYEYFNSIALNSDGISATVALPAEQVNSRPDDHRRQLHSIRYDSSTDEIEVVVDYGVLGEAALRYFVSAPRSIIVLEFDHTKVIVVDDASGARTLIRLFDPARSGHADLAARGGMINQGVTFEGHAHPPAQF
jgi:hypothetical protein